ncbi:PREDICTED: NADH dehydrogenase (ubiquinone) complex I, assembly factor 6, partial [Papilio xuthus]|uniref:NADH dehydrogenase (Ubiquinone) complex I, assembly factor 6 n=1 Tax=Papilio xuthus TaxID=66420 RepID=A0AAJ6ZA60_PAPXU
RQWNNLFRHSTLANNTTYVVVFIEVYNTSHYAPYRQDITHKIPCRQHDYENFLATLLMTKAIRTPALVVRAFNVEVARVQDQTSDPQTAAFRVHFWLDILNDIYKKEQNISNIPANPVAKELFKICKCYNLPKRHLEKLVLSRSSLLKSRYFRTLEDIEKYADDTVSSIYHLLLAVAGVTDIHADHAASHLGKSQGLTNILRSVHVSNHHKMVTLPMDILMKNKLSQEEVLREKDSEEMRNVVFEVASRAYSHLEKARKIQTPKITNQIFLPATAVDFYLNKLQKNNFNIFDKSLHQGNATLPFKLYYNRLVNKY